MIKWNYVISSLVLITCLEVGASQTLTLKKDKVVDFLFLNDLPDNRDAKLKYFKDLGPVGKSLGYQPTFAFKIDKKPIQGNYFPNILAIAEWPGDMDNRYQLFDKLLTKVPDLHARRFDVWSSFHMTNYYMDEELQLTFNEDKRYVLTAFWQKDKKAFSQYLGQYLEQVKQAGGKVMLSLKEGQSPDGYLYNPDLTLITEWGSMQAIDSFTLANKANDRNKTGVKHINELHLELVNRTR